jgi:sugar phosphate isomerase/epimerase
VNRFAVQLYTLRELDGLDAQLEAAAKAGYRAVETLHDHGGLSALDLRDRLELYGLQAVSSHVPLEALEADPAGVAAYHRAVGTPLIVVPWLAPERYGDNAASWRRLGRLLAELGRACKAQRMQLAYHNHDFEMRDIDGRPAIDFLMQEAGNEVVLELDLAWVVRGGQNPLELLKRYQGKVPRIHVKDIAPQGENADEDGWADVGHGTLDWSTLLPAARAAGTDWFIVEHDKPSDPTASIGRSLEFLNKLYA